MPRKSALKTVFATLFFCAALGGLAFTIYLLCQLSAQMTALNEKLDAKNNPKPTLEVSQATLEDLSRAYLAATGDSTFRVQTLIPLGARNSVSTPYQTLTVEMCKTAYTGEQQAERTCKTGLFYRSGPTAAWVYFAVGSDYLNTPPHAAPCEVFDMPDLRKAFQGDVCVPSSWDSCAWAMFSNGIPLCEVQPLATD